MKHAQGTLMDLTSLKLIKEKSTVTPQKIITTMSAIFAKQSS